MSLFVWSVLLNLAPPSDEPVIHELYVRACTATDARLFAARQLVLISTDKDPSSWLRRIIGVRLIPRPTPETALSVEIP